MTTPIELITAPSTTVYRVDHDFDGFMPDMLVSQGEGHPDDGHAEITQRRAQLENADVLRLARAL